MDIVIDVFGWVFILIGCFFAIVGALGLLRLPDVYTRIHSAGVVDTVAAAFLLIGFSFYAGLSLVTVKLVLILVFIFFTSPTATNALANAMYSQGIKPALVDEEDSPSKP
jgi:multicomponent Na+:H+ antiporter subunit G